MNETIQFNDAQTQPPLLRERNIFVTVFLILALVINFASMIYNIYLAVSEPNGILSGLQIVLNFANIAGFMMLLYWKRMGFYLLCGTTVVNIILNLAFTSGQINFPAFIIGALMPLGILWFVLHIKKNDVPCWDYLVSDEELRDNYELDTLAATSDVDLSDDVEEEKPSVLKRIGFAVLGVLVYFLIKMLIRGGF